MWYAAQLAHAVDDAGAFGISVKRGMIDWQKLVAGRDEYVGNINDYWDGYIEKAGIERIQGHAKFIDSTTVVVNGEYYFASHLRCLFLYSLISYHADIRKGKL